jgi:hypothetical protein
MLRTFAKRNRNILWHYQLIDVPQDVPQDDAQDDTQTDTQENKLVYSICLSLRHKNPIQP